MDSSDPTRRSSGEDGGKGTRQPGMPSEPSASSPKSPANAPTRTSPMGTWRLTSRGPMSLRRGRPGPETRSSMRGCARDPIRPGRVERAWAEREAWAERKGLDQGRGFGRETLHSLQGVSGINMLRSLFRRRPTERLGCRGRQVPTSNSPTHTPTSRETLDMLRSMFCGTSPPWAPRAGAEAAAKREGRARIEGVLLLTGAVIVERGVARPNLSLSVLS